MRLTNPMKLLVVAQFEMSQLNHGVIPSGAVFQAERRISRLTGLMRKARLHHHELS
jgi:hypothetical protein